jgi:hypothetical protein
MFFAFASGDIVSIQCLSSGEIRVGEYRLPDFLQPVLIAVNKISNGMVFGFTWFISLPDKLPLIIF